jgi:hypothetical protein
MNEQAAASAAGNGGAGSIDFLSGLATIDDDMIALIDLPRLLSPAGSAEKAASH